MRLPLNSDKLQQPVESRIRAGALCSLSAVLFLHQVQALRAEHALGSLFFKPSFLVGILLSLFPAEPP